MEIVELKRGCKLPVGPSILATSGAEKKSMSLTVPELVLPAKKWKMFMTIAPGKSKGPEPSSTSFAITLRGESESEYEASFH